MPRNIRELQIVPTYTRASYRQEIGQEPPPFDASRPIKRWFDPNPKPSYFVFSDGRFEVFLIADSLARTVNLPGVMQYPAYEVKPTPAVTVSTMGGETFPVDPSYLSTNAEAVSMAADLGLPASAVSENVLGGPYFIDYRGDDRRMWMIERSGGKKNVGSLLAQRNRNGVGSPGRWDVSGAEPVWVTEVRETGEGDDRPETPVPVRPLNADEKLRNTLAGWVIVPAGEMTDREMLEAIYAAVTAPKGQ